MSIQIFKGDLFTDKNEAITGSLSFKQRIAIKGYVAFNMENAKTKAQKKFQAYTVLANAPRQAYFPIQEELTSFIDEKDMFSIFKYIENKAVPMQLWADKVKDDIKDLKVKNAVPSIFVNYCDFLINGEPQSTFSGDFRLALFLCRDILQDNTLDYLHDICHVIISDIAEEVGYGTKVESVIFINTKDKNFKKDIVLLQGLDICISMFRPMSLISASFEDMMSSLEDTEEFKILEEKELEEDDIVAIFEQVLDNENDLGLSEDEVREDVEFTIKYLINRGYTKDVVEKCFEQAQVNKEKSIREMTNEKVTYVVSKVSQSIDKRVVSTIEFDTLARAEEYIKSIEDNFPDIAENFDFKIEIK